MVQLILMIVHVMGIISSILIEYHILFKQTWVFMDTLFHQGKLVYEGTYLFPTIINSHYYVLQKTNPLTQFFFRDNKSMEM